MTRTLLPPLILAALVSYSPIAVPSSPAIPPSGPPYPIGGEPADVPGTMFSCKAKVIAMSRERLEKIAIAEIEKRGNRVGDFDSKISTRGCDWIVGILIKPAAPGAHYGVRIDGVTGDVKEFFGGS